MEDSQNGAMPISALDRFPFTPARYAGQPDAPAFLIAPLDKRRRMRLDADLLRLRGRFPTVEDVRAVLRIGIETTLEGVFQERALEALDVIEEEIDDEITPTPEQLAAHKAAEGVVRAANVVVQQRFAPLRDLTAAQYEWMEEHAIHRFRLGVVGWSGVKNGHGGDLPCAIENDLITEEALKALAAEDIDAASKEVQRLSSLSPGQRGNSEPR